MRFTGSGAIAAFQPEAGGHRWQRIPPTEKRGRKQTSSITVAVVADAGDSGFAMDPADIRYETYIGQGPGGQHRQKNATAVRATHVPTGTVACCESERSQKRNKDEATRVLRSRLADAAEARRQSEGNATRRAQIGTGYRGDKIRTVQVQNGVVTSHVNGKKLSYDRYAKGHVEKLH